jgi:hypothetical protein
MKDVSQVKIRGNGLHRPNKLINFEMTENGAMVVRDKMEFEEFYLAYIVDPVGLGLGLIERK